jgi:phytoene desaturase
VQLGGFRRMHALIASFLQDWHLIRLFTFQAMYAGMSPFEALGIYATIPTWTPSPGCTSRAEASMP